MQGFIHWLEEGRGDTILRVVTLALFVVLSSFYLSGKRYQGPGNERVLERAVLAQQLADGKGFTARVWHPQAILVMEQRNRWQYADGATLPDLYTPPGYPLVMAGALKAMPERFLNWLESEPFRTYYLADFFLLGVSLFFFWANMALIAHLAYTLFGARAAWLSAAGYLVSAGVWEGIFSVDGSLMLSFLLLLLLLVTIRFELAKNHWRKWIWPPLAGLLVGALFLTDYPAGLILFPTALYFGWRGWRKSERAYQWPEGALTVALIGLCFAGAIAPWLIRNIELTGHPLALAGQEIAWRAGDPTAEPETFRGAMTGETADLNFRKIINKGLDGMAAGVKGDLWQGGGLLFVGFFLASLFYQFRNASTNALRWFALGLIVIQWAGGPFLDSAEAPLNAGAWLGPLFIVFGAGFFFVMMDSAVERLPWRNVIFITAVLVMQALPMIHWILQPGVRANYTFPPYAPTVFRAVKIGMADNFHPGYGVMSDAPAGLAWYGKMTVWAQPNEMKDFVAVVERQPIGALLLTPHRLDQPYFTELLRSDGPDFRKDPAWGYGWGAVYHGLASGRVPAFFPLQKPIRIWDNIYVCLDPLAYRPGALQFK